MKRFFHAHTCMIHRMKCRLCESDSPDNNHFSWNFTYRLASLYNSHQLWRRYVPAQRGRPHSTDMWMIIRMSRIHASKQSKRKEKLMKRIHSCRAERAYSCFHGTKKECAYNEYISPPVLRPTAKQHIHTRISYQCLIIVHTWNEAAWMTKKNWNAMCEYHKLLWWWTCYTAIHHLHQSKNPSHYAIFFKQRIKI